VPIYDFAIANEELANEDTDGYYPCCSKNICKGCVYSFRESGNDEKCPFCNSDRAGKTDQDIGEETRKRVEANDAASIFMMANLFNQGLHGFQQDNKKAMELYARAADLGYTKAHNNLAGFHHEGGNLKKAKFHFEAAAMAGDEVARFNLGVIENDSRNLERAVKHWTIAASAGDFCAMHQLITGYGFGRIGRESIDWTLAAYNNACAKMRSKARDAYIRTELH
jgi:TPR repeat protein